VSKKTKGDDKDEPQTQAPATPLPTEEQDLAADSVKHDRRVKEGQDRAAEASQGEQPPEAEGGEGNPVPPQGPASSMGADGPDPLPVEGDDADGPDPAPRVKLSGLLGLREHLEGVVAKVQDLHDRIEDKDLAGKLRQAHGAADNLLDAIRGILGKRGVSAPVPQPEGKPDEGEAEAGGPVEGVQPPDQQPAG
jgi:hypothetical protein